MYSISIKRKATLQENIWMLILAGVCPWLLPIIHQSDAYHHFADNRMFLNIPNFMDVFSNVGFMFSGLYCIYILYKYNSYIQHEILPSLVTFALGTLLTAAGSSYYHLNPENATLMWDRLPMTITFAGLLGVMAYQISKDYFFTTIMLMTSLVFGIAAVLYWNETSNLTPYIFMQFGGLLWLIFHMYRYKKEELLKWPALIACYILAKLMESLDVIIYQATSNIVSGHTLKHYVAAAGVTYLVYSIANALKQNVKN